MSEPFIGQIIMFGGNFAPRGWALCNGQLLPISQHSALFAILGTAYGGDGRTTFALPDLRGRVPVHPGQGPGLTDRQWGEKAGAESHTLTTGQIPSHNHAQTAHTHQARGNTQAGNVQNPANTVWATEAVGATATYSNRAPNTNMSPDAIDSGGGGDTGNTGGAQAHNNMPPFLGVYFIIALTGLFPSRN